MTSEMSSTPSSDCSPSSSPLAANAPKFGTPVPNRIFVGGIAPNTTEAELHALFSSFGNVKATKIISDRAGVSKGYGFVTFETEEEARRIQKEAENLTLKDRKLNIAPAIKKQPFARVYGDVTGVTLEGGAGPGPGPGAAAHGSILYHNGIPYTYHNGMAFFTNSPDSVFQYPQPQAATYPVVYPQTLYVPQTFSYQAPTSPAVPTHYFYAAAASPLGGVSPSGSVPSSPSPCPSPGEANSATASTSTVAGQASNAAAGEFYTLYNGSSMQPGGVISVMPTNYLGFALAPPTATATTTSAISPNFRADLRLGPLTPTSPDYNFDGDAPRNNEVLTPSSSSCRFVFNSTSSNYNHQHIYSESPTCHPPVAKVYQFNSGARNRNESPYQSPGYHFGGYNHETYGYKNQNGGGNNNSNAAACSNSNSDSHENLSQQLTNGNKQNYNGSGNNCNQMATGSDTYGSSKQNGGGGGGGHSKGGNNANNQLQGATSGGGGGGNTSYGGGSSDKNGGGGYKGNGNCLTGNRKNSAVSCASPPSRNNGNYHGGYRHPSTPKNDNNYGRRDRSNSTSGLSTRSSASGGYDVVSTRTFRHLRGQQPHLVAKSVNGVTVMALPAPLMVTSGLSNCSSQGVPPTTMLNVSAKDHHLIQGPDFMIGSNSTPMTPPQTPATPPKRMTVNNDADHLMSIKKLTL